MVPHNSRVVLIFIRLQTKPGDFRYRSFGPVSLILTGHHCVSRQTFHAGGVAGLIITRAGRGGIRAWFS